MCEIGEQARRSFRRGDPRPPSPPSRGLPRTPRGPRRARLERRRLWPQARRGARGTRADCSTTAVTAVVSNRAAVTIGSTAPQANAAADANAASNGRAAVSSTMPSSSRACAFQGVVRRQLLRNLSRERPLESSSDVDVRELVELRGRCSRGARCVHAPDRRARCRPGSSPTRIASCHRQRSGNKASHTGKHDVAAFRIRRGDSDNQTGD